MGKCISILTINPALYTALDAADEPAEMYGLKPEVINARFINPISYEKILSPVGRTGKLVLVSRNWITPAAELEKLFFPQK